MPLNEARFMRDTKKKKKTLVDRMQSQIATAPSDETQMSVEPEVEKAVAKEAVKSGDAEVILEKKLKPAEKKQVVKAIDKGVKPKSNVASKFTDALLLFTPQLVGAALGGIVEGSEGALAGAQEGAKAGQVLATSEQAKVGALAAQEKAKLAAKEVGIKEEDAATRARMADIAGEKLEESKRQFDAKLLDVGDSTKKRLNNLKGEDKKVVTFTMTADRALNNMMDVLNDPGSEAFTTGELIGTSTFTDARDRFINAMLRRESGAAISDEEYDRFRNFVPSMTDSREQQIEKMKRNRSAIDDTLHVYQLSRGDLNLPKPITAMTVKDKKSRIAELRAKRGVK